MQATTRSLTIELLGWIAKTSRTYDETMDAWRSSCPRHPVWDDAAVEGLVRVERGGAATDVFVVLTPLGEAMLATEKQGERYV